MDYWPEQPPSIKKKTKENFKTRGKKLIINNKNPTQLVKYYQQHLKTATKWQ